MAQASKRLKAIREQLEPGKAYGIDEALDLLKGSSKVKFTESVDVAIRLGVDSRKSDQNVRVRRSCPTEPASRYVLQYLPRVKTQKRQKLRALM